ncbi:hypothetical protein DFP72DRAFT_1074878 [Ephemerocybe angulata]|uniref:Uncharacterized protein n=1 Tax=Ephemerocybe angulata TaxID=980116 RepID=A0A8H6HK22_9AGAR|nr:hypothetical protein DFP72DRAFT_1074878 [Tulosesus angulatus]
MLFEEEVRDEDVELMVADAKAISRDERWPLVKCAFYGSRCTKPFIVPAAVQCVSVNTGRTMDVVFRSYVNAAVPRASLVYNLDHFMIEVNRYPACSLVEGPWRYTIFTSMNAHDAQNTLVQSLYKGSQLTIFGCLLVAKSDHMGAIQPVVESDMSQIETMLVEALTMLDKPVSESASVCTAADLISNY